VSPAGVGYREGPPTLLYLVVMHEDASPAVKHFLSDDGLLRFAKTHREDKARGYDWGPYDVYAIFLDGGRPEITRTTIEEVHAELVKRCHLIVEARRKAAGL